MPAHCTAAGESPRATDDRERHDGEMAEIGATMPIAPIAIPR